jgi:hypothetical protein
VVAAVFGGSTLRVIRYFPRDIVVGVVLSGIRIWNGVTLMSSSLWAKVFGTANHGANYLFTMVYERHGLARF